MKIPTGKERAGSSVRRAVPSKGGGWPQTPPYEWWRRRDE